MFFRLHACSSAERFPYHLHALSDAVSFGLSQSQAITLAVDAQKKSKGKLGRSLQEKWNHWR
jgi:hypothetical protein